MLSLRHRIALSHLLLIAACLGGLGWLGLQGIRHRQRLWLADQLLHRAELLAHEIGGADIDTMRQELLRVAVRENYRLRVYRGQMLIFDSGRLHFRFQPGRVVIGSGPPNRGPWDAVGPELAQAQGGKSASSVVELPPDDPLPQEKATIPRLMVAVPGPTCIIHLSRSLLDLEQIYLDDELSLLEAGLGMAALASCLSFFLARMTLEPVRKLSAAAQSLSKGQLSVRIGSRSSDELGTLSRTFDHLAAKLEEREQLQRQFSADASHELKTPLSSLKALCDALLAGAAEEPELARRFAEMMAGQLARLETLVTDLTELHRLEAGPRVKPSHVDLADLVLRTAEQFRPSYARLELKRPETAMAWIDRERVQQVLLNLLENARRALGDHAHGRIQIGIEGPLDGFWTVRVCDNGSGIDPSEQEKIFERFYRCGTDRSRHEGGSGLGLAICKKIVEGHGGRIWVESTPETRFMFTLPQTRVL